MLFIIPTKLDSILIKIDKIIPKNVWEKRCLTLLPNLTSRWLHSSARRIIRYTLSAVCTSTTRTYRQQYILETQQSTLCCETYSLSLCAVYHSIIEKIADVFLFCIYNLQISFFLKKYYFIWHMQAYCTCFKRRRHINFLASVQIFFFLHTQFLKLLLFLFFIFSLSAAALYIRRISNLSSHAQRTCAAARSPHRPHMWAKNSVKEKSANRCYSKNTYA